jgi:hypothetical protein
MTRFDSASLGCTSLSTAGKEVDESGSTIIICKASLLIVYLLLPSWSDPQLVKCGFKEIEIAYPAASETDFSFVRMIVDKKMGVDEDVWVQVGLPQSLCESV